VFQRQWNICIESNGPRGAMTSEYSQSEWKGVASHVRATWHVYEENFSHGESPKNSCANVTWMATVSIPAPMGLRVCLWWLSWKSCVQSHFPSDMLFTNKTRFIWDSITSFHSTCLRRWKPPCYCTFDASTSTLQLICGQVSWGLANRAICFAICRLTGVAHHNSLLNILPELMEK
jgi:hypothetical protein